MSTIVIWLLLSDVSQTTSLGVSSFHGGRRTQSTSIRSLAVLAVQSSIKIMKIIMTPPHCRGCSCGQSCHLPGRQFIVLLVLDEVHVIMLKAFHVIIKICAYICRSKLLARSNTLNPRCKSPYGCHHAEHVCVLASIGKFKNIRRSTHFFSLMSFFPE